MKLCWTRWSHLASEEGVDVLLGLGGEATDKVVVVLAVLNDTRAVEEVTESQNSKGVSLLADHPKVNINGQLLKDN